MELAGAEKNSASMKTDWPILAICTGFYDGFGDVNDHLTLARLSLIPDRPNRIVFRWIHIEDLAWLALESVGKGFQALLRIALNALLELANIAFGHPDALGKLFLGQSAVLPPLLEENAAPLNLRLESRLNSFSHAEIV
jgi:hypothetical protein